MKQAGYHIESVSLCCPHCGELLSGDDGSQNFLIDNFALEDTLKCESCGRKCRVPEKLIEEGPVVYQ